MKNVLLKQKKIKICHKWGVFFLENKIVGYRACLQNALNFLVAKKFKMNF